MLESITLSPFSLIGKLSGTGRRFELFAFSQFLPFPISRCLLTFRFQFHLSSPFNFSLSLYYYYFLISSNPLKSAPLFLFLFFLHLPLKSAPPSLFFFFFFSQKKKSVFSPEKLVIMANSSENPSRAQREFLLHSHSSISTESIQNQNHQPIFPTYLGRPTLLSSSFEQTNSRLDHSHFHSVSFFFMSLFETGILAKRVVFYISLLKL